MPPDPAESVGYCVGQCCEIAEVLFGSGKRAVALGWLGMMPELGEKRTN